MEINRDDLTGTEIAEFLREHLANMAEHSPPESVHAGTPFRLDPGGELVSQNF